ncbi:hypothetical protein KL930_004010 [Ogataea haglerorum]|uniref:Uncharacterized protein n=1 Tax=Ogataea haglerorum TaxID=1937702 RepID=A0AAN6I2Q7_9ASCO|nr:hypothetical protein KL915_004285 [Ogataea haglerorum]KAG7694209.1 hypothetical protein KL951_004087 [Ogataea haglerorum]KAG7730399.1 hypothetical protein KL933_000194 [Ogataea haglerorum]KAG7742576.1 hypothetical protein KL923_000191 [Ogataea haglerorum]KAG7756075.1 hypothetical protein KL947_004124 [Ogataea haglerorum]
MTPEGCPESRSDEGCRPGTRGPGNTRSSNSTALYFFRLVSGARMRSQQARGGAGLVTREPCKSKQIEPTTRN